MSEMVERGAIAMQDRFKDRIANLAGKPFADTGVELPSMDIWRDYAAAAIDAMREPTPKMINAAAKVRYQLEQMLPGKAQLISIASQEIAKLRAEINAMKTAQRRCL